MTNNYIQKTIKRFREQFHWDEEYGYYREPSGETVTNEEIEAFLKETLKDFAKEVDKTIESMQKKVNMEGSYGKAIGDSYYNQALENIKQKLALLTEEKDV